MHEQTRLLKDELAHRTELENVQEDAEYAHILSNKQESMIRLDMQQIQVEAMALEEPIEKIQDQMSRLETETAIPMNVMKAMTNSL